MQLGLAATILGGLVVFAHKSYCWGNLGHRTIAYLAEKHFTEKGSQYAAELLGGEDISDAAIWADEYKNTDEGRYTGSWHFVNAKDNPPLSCNVRVDRDCAANRTCIITAISNVLRDANVPPAGQTRAFKFLLHLIGDLHNPLHAESVSRGGNDIRVLFAGAPTNLHFIWDVDILLKRTGSTPAREIAAARSWAATLFENESPLGLPGGETCCVNVNVTQPARWAWQWASEANSWVCKYVLKDGPAVLVGQELGGDYFQGAVPVVDELLSKAGRRLGMLVNGLAAAGHSPALVAGPERMEL